MKNTPGIGANTLYRLGGVGVQYLFFFVTALLVSHYLGKSRLGDFFLAVTVLNLLGYGSTLGLQQGVVRYTAVYRARGEKLRLRGAVLFSAVLSAAVGTAGAVGLYRFSEPLAVAVFHSPPLAPALRTVAFAVPFLAFFNVMVAGLQGFKNIRLKILLENIMLPGLALTLAAALFLFRSPSLQLAAAGWTGAVAACSLPAAYFLGVLCGWRGGGSGSGFGEVLSYSLPLAVVGFLYYLFTRMDILMIGGLRGPGEVGVYGLAARLAMLVPLPLEAINAIFEPTVAEHDGGDSRRLSDLYKKYTPWVLGSGLTGFLALLLATPAILAIFGREFSGGWLIMAVLGGGQVVNLAVGSAGVLVSMTGHSRLVLYNCLAMVALNFCLNLLLIPPYGALGAAAATSAALAGINLLRLAEVRLLLGIDPFSPVYWKVGAWGAGAFLAAGLGWKLLGGCLGLWALPLLLAAVPVPLAGGLWNLLQREKPGVFFAARAGAGR